MRWTVALDVRLRLNLRFDPDIAKRVGDWRDPSLPRLDDSDLFPGPRASTCQTRPVKPFSELLRFHPRLDHIVILRVDIFRADIEPHDLPRQSVGSWVEFDKIYLVAVAI